MGLLDNLLHDDLSEERCDCCQCDITNRPGCSHGRSRLRIPACDTCPTKKTRPVED